MPRIFDVIQTRPLLSSIGLWGSAGSYGGLAHRCSLPQCSDGRFGAGKRDGTSAFGARVGMSMAPRRVLVRIQHHELAVAGRDRIDAAVGVHGRMVLVGRGFVVHERMVVAHVPQGHDEVALDALRARRRRRHFALGDAFGPVGVGLERSLLALVVEHAVHRGAAHAGAEPPFPGLRMRLELRLRLQDVVDVARLGVAELMAEVAVGFDRVDPMVLGQHVRAEPVALRARAGKLLCGRRLEQRQPVVARIDLRRFLRSFGERRGQRHRVVAGFIWIGVESTRP